MGGLGELRRFCSVAAPGNRTEHIPEVFGRAQTISTEHFAHRLCFDSQKAPGHGHFPCRRTDSNPGHADHDSAALWLLWLGVDQALLRARRASPADPTAARVDAPIALLTKANTERAIAAFPSRSSGTPIRSNASAAGADRATGSTLPANVLPAATALCMLGPDASSFAHTPVERSA
jgi:hypothetical protein